MAIRDRLNRTPLHLAVRLGVVLAAAMVATSAGPPALAEAPLVAFRASVGETFKVSVEIEDRRLRDTTLEAHVKRHLTYDGRIVAVEPDGRGYRIGWTLRTVSSEILIDTTGNQPLVLAGALSASQGLMNRELVMVTNADGKPLRLLDWEQHKAAVAPVVQRAFEDVITKSVLARRPDADPQAIASIAAKQGEALVAGLVLKHDDASAVALVDEATTLALVQGLHLSPGKPLSIKDTVSGPITAGEVARTATYTLMPRSDNGLLRITWTTSFDKAALQAAAGEAIRRQLADALASVDSESIKEEVKRKFDAHIASIKVERSDTGEGDVDPKSGWALRVVRRTRTQTQQVATPTERREQVVTITVTR